MTLRLREGGGSSRLGTATHSVRHFINLSSPCTFTCANTLSLPPSTPDKWLGGAEVTAFSEDRQDPEACVHTVSSDRDTGRVPFRPSLSHSNEVRVFCPILHSAHCRNSVAVTPPAGPVQTVEDI